MNFQLAKIGQSFKGSMAYYLHDKPQDREAQPVTAERVAWTETRNLATDGPHTATRIMIATAQQADELKAAAGVKNTGRKATSGPVFAFSLQWRADELPDRDRAEMVRAADHALKVLKLDHLQAVIVAHNDQAHPHVHVIVNRINPENGKMTSVRAPDVKALDRWADQYERERGQIVSPKRAEKYDRQEHNRRQHPDAEKRRRYMRDRNAELKAKRKARPTPAADFERAAAGKPTDKTPAGMLKELGDAQKARHRQEWAALAADQKRRRQAIYDIAGRHIRDELARAKEQGRPLWSQFLKFQRDERRGFEARERTLAGKVANCIAAAKIQERRCDPSNPRGFLTMAFAYVGARDARLQTFKAEQERMRLGFAAEQKAAADGRIALIKQARTDTLAKSRTAMLAERGALIERHGSERAKVREAWRQLNLQRGRTPTRSRQENPTMPSMDDFRRAAQLPDTNRPKMQPTTPRAVAQPAPAPAPAGLPQPPARTVRDVPKVDQAAAWAKSEQGRTELAKTAPAPQAGRQFDQATKPEGVTHYSATGPRLKSRGFGLPPAASEQPATPALSKQPAQTPPAQQAASPQSRSEYWGERMKAKAAEMSRDQSRDKSQNKKQDQDQEPKM